MKSRFLEVVCFLDAILRNGVLIDKPRNSNSSRLRKLLTVIVFCGLLYGIAMGSYAWLAGTRTFHDACLQMSYSGIKVPMLLLATFALTWPAFAVISTLFGLRDDMSLLTGLVMSSQATGAIILLSFSPIVLFTYVSVGHSQTTYSAAVLLNFVFFAVASLASHWRMRRNIKSFATGDHRHAIMLWFWVILYGFAGIQMAWIMRPFVGQPNADTTFFRAESWDNAYVKLMEIAKSLIFPDD